MKEFKNPKEVRYSVALLGRTIEEFKKECFRLSSCYFSLKGSPHLNAMLK